MLQVAETPFTNRGSKHTKFMIEFIVKNMSAQSFALQSLHACDISVTHLCLIMLFESRSTLLLTINMTVYTVNYKMPIHCILYILRDKTLNQGCPNYGPQANCGPWSIFNWPAANSKNIMEYGPCMKRALDCIVLLSFNTRWSYCPEQGSFSTKQAGDQKWQNQRNAR